MADEVVEWDVINGTFLGAVIRCPDCPCQPGEGCDGDGLLHRPYRLPGGAMLDVWSDADLYVALLDRDEERRRNERPTE